MLVTNGISGFVDTLKGMTDTSVAVLSIVHSNRPILTLTNDVNSIKDQLTNVHMALGGSTSRCKYTVDSIPGGNIGSSLGYSKDSQKVFVVLTDTRNEVNTGVTEQDAADKLQNDPNITSDNIKTFVLGLNFSSFNSTNTFSQDSAYDDIVRATGGAIYKPSDANKIKETLEGELTTAILNEKQVRTVNLQVGANNGQILQLDTSDVRSVILGINNLKVDNYDNAQKSILKIDKALKTVSGERSRYGAIQNRLEHIHNNLINYSLNINESESRIRDVDYALAAEVVISKVVLAGNGKRL